MYYTYYRVTPNFLNFFCRRCSIFLCSIWKSDICKSFGLVILIIHIGIHNSRYISIRFRCYQHLLAEQNYYICCNILQGYKNAFVNVGVFVKKVYKHIHTHIPTYTYIHNVAHLSLWAPHLVRRHCLGASLHFCAFIIPPPAFPPLVCWTARLLCARTYPPASQTNSAQQLWLCLSSHSHLYEHLYLYLYLPTHLSW